LSSLSPLPPYPFYRYLYFGNIKLERLDISTTLDLLIASDELSLEDFTCEIQTYFIHLNSDWLKTKIVPILQCCYSNPTAFSKLMLHTLTIIKRDPTCLLIQNYLHLLSAILHPVLTVLWNDWQFDEPWNSYYTPLCTSTSTGPRRTQPPLYAFPLLIASCSRFVFGSRISHLADELISPICGLPCRRQLSRTRLS
jgi:hypothetical protein